MHAPLRIHVRRSQRNLVILAGHAHGPRDWGKQAHRLPNHRVEVRQRIELLHRRAIRRDTPELLPQLVLDVGLLGECIQTPRCRIAGRLVPSDKEPVSSSLKARPNACRFDARWNLCRQLQRATTTA